MYSNIGITFVAEQTPAFPFSIEAIIRNEYKYGKLVTYKDNGTTSVVQRSRANIRNHVEK